MMSVSREARNEYERQRASGHYDLGDDQAYITDKIEAARHIEMCVEFFRSQENMPDYLCYLADSLERLVIDSDNDVTKERLFAAFKLEETRFTAKKQERLFRDALIVMYHDQGVPIDAPKDADSLVSRFCFRRETISRIINSQKCRDLSN